jgi:hypothetical protein
VLGQHQVSGLHGGGNLVENLVQRHEQRPPGPSRRASWVVGEQEVDGDGDRAPDERVEQPSPGARGAGRLGDRHDQRGDGSLVDEQRPAPDRDGRGGGDAVRSLLRRPER